MITRKTGPHDLASVLFGKTRLAVLSLLYSRLEESFYLRQISRMCGAGLGPLQRELKALEKAGIIIRERSGHQVYYRANPGCPIFPELKGIIAKTSGISDVISKALSPVSRGIELAFIYGSHARGEAGPESDVDLIVAGDIDDLKLHESLGKAEEGMGRTINYTLFSKKEFLRRKSEKRGFLSRVLLGPKVFIIGEEDEI